MNRSQVLTCMDLFAGAGGLSEGFRVAGFRVLVANDWDEYCAATYRVNHPDTAFVEGSIEHLRGSDFLRAARMEGRQLDCLVGGPPCQAFSVYNHQRGMHDERSRLFREYLRLVEELNPNLIVMENVPGITSVSDGHAVREILTGLSRLGYHVEHRILKAEQYGVPQERRRVFFVGTRLGTEILWPIPTHGEGLLPYVTVWDAIGDLPALRNSEGYDEQEYTRLPFSDYQRWSRTGVTKLYNHVAPSLAPINLERLKYIQPGGSWRDIPMHMLPAGMKRARRCDHTKRYGRLHPHGLASTILTKCDPHWGAYFHPEQDRVITVREAARLQSFPDRIRFSGPRSEQYRQVGNAVPPLLAAAVAECVKTMAARMSEGRLKRVAY